MFGGNTVDPFTHRKLKNAGYTSDLWVFSLNNSIWSCLSGCPSVPASRSRSRSAGESGSRSSGLATTQEGSRTVCRRRTARSARWTNSKGKLWLFGSECNKMRGNGGRGVTGSHSGSPYESVARQKRDRSREVVEIPLSDLWLFDTRNLTWKLMSSSDNNTTRGGTEGVECSRLSSGSSSGHNIESRLQQYRSPLGRYDSVQWSLDNNFFLFGGIGPTAGRGGNESGFLDDQWVLNVSYVLLVPSALTPAVIFLFYLARLSSM